MEGAAARLYAKTKEYMILGCGPRLVHQHFMMVACRELIILRSID
jgi:hypothetical protein